jgi:hypothetical protein
VSDVGVGRIYMKVFLAVVSGLMVLLGTGWLFFPETMLGWWDAQTDATGVYVARRYGALLFGYAAILWLGRASGPSSARAAILGGGALVTALVTLLSFAGVVTGTIGPGAWGAVVIEAVLTAGFVYYFVTGRTQTQAKAGS